MNSSAAGIRCVALIGLLAGASVGIADEVPDFQREVRPILSGFCFRCHGFDEQARQGGLRLDTATGAMAPADSGQAAVVPGRPDESELIRRLTCDDPSERMPPVETGKTLTAVQVDVLRRWIAGGAGYAPHWAFVKPVARPLPTVRRLDWSRNLIDRFVLARLEQEGLTPAPEADPERLLRRVSLDLTGLPPSPEDLDRFLEAAAQHFDAAYEAEVDRLLASPHFGERMALDWLDAARYADTNGYFSDRPRQIWPWRDWVIAAFNDNKPFDRFTVEQLAGDLLPDATRDQRVATGFHRNTMANNESGIIDEEFRVEAVADRVETTATVWLGMTIGCAQCHDHKFDPVSQRDYYRLFAFFNNSVETGLVKKDTPPPTIAVPTAEQEATLRHLEQQRRQAEQTYRAVAGTLDAELAAWELSARNELASPPDGAALRFDFDAEPEGWQVVGTSLAHERGIRRQAGTFDATQHLEAAVKTFRAGGPWTISVWAQPTNSLSGIWSKIEPEGRRRGLEMIWQKGRLQVNLVSRWGQDELTVSTRDPMTSRDWHHLIVSHDGSRTSTGLQVFIDGRPAELEVHRDTLSGSLDCEEPFRLGRRDAGLGFYGRLDEFRVLESFLAPDEAAGWFDGERLRGILDREAKDRTAAEQSLLREYYVRHHADGEVQEAHGRWQAAQAEEQAARAAIPETLVMQEREERRKTHLLQRGQYDQPGEEVQPGVPEVLQLAPDRESANRRDLAEWLVDPDHPLTARVAVNRLWQMCFGEGLVRTPNDFGLQGELPTHPELLDALALRFIADGWDVKAMLRRIVTSSTYRQSSAASAELTERDPENRLLARGPRFRLPAEVIRDQALAVSGRLSRRMGGPSVKPWQPEGLWEEVSYNAEESYVPDIGEGLWRRSLYTYIKRQAPPPALLTFDANTREKCLIKRSRTNTPLQALVTLNDPTYVEAARSLAVATLQECCGRSDSHALQLLFRRVVSRRPEVEETDALIELLEKQRRAFAADRAAVEQLLSNHDSPTQTDPVELAAWTLVAQAILNLDEVVTRR